MDIVRFVNPDMLWLSALVVPMVAYYVYRMRQGGATMRISTIDGVRRVPRTRFKITCATCRWCSVASPWRCFRWRWLRAPSTIFEQHHRRNRYCIVARRVGQYAGPRFTPRPPRRGQRGGLNFIVDRPNDRIGLVVFAGESFTQSLADGPIRSLPLNPGWAVRSGMIDDGTGHRQRTGDGREPPQGEQCEKQGGGSCSPTA
ncbi:MAG: hypothetical protein ACLR8Y_08105 [Alistipes indistinctus]